MRMRCEPDRRRWGDDLSGRHDYLALGGYIDHGRRRRLDQDIAALV